MDKNKFGNFIREKRLENDLTQKELADKLMIDVTAVSKWERGVNYPDITMIPDICTYLGINEHELIESSTDTEYRSMRADAEKYNKIKNTIFYSFTLSYAAAVLICFIVNLASAHTLSWFFTVAAGCLCGFTFCPTCLRFFKKYKLSVFVVSTFVSLALLFFICSAVSGNWWLWVGISSVLLGYFAVFYPILFKKQESYMGEERYICAKKYFLISYAVGLLLLTVLLIACAALYTAGDLPMGLKIAGYCFAALIVFGIVELLPIERPFKLGIDSAVAGAHLYGLNAVLNSLIGESGAYQYSWYSVNFSDWEHYSNGNISIIGLGVFFILTVLFTLIGVLKKRR